MAYNIYIGPHSINVEFIKLKSSMSYFRWKEEGLTSDCSSLQSMASRFEESAKLMRKMAEKGFKLERREGKQFITHHNQDVFEEWGFINEEPPFKQLNLIN